MLDYTGDELIFSTGSERSAAMGFNRDQSRACMVADTLAWAVTHHIPLHEALRGLPFYRDRRIGPRGRRALAFLRDLFIPFRPFFWIMNMRWSYHVRVIIEDLENGEPLSSTLERNLGRHFPGFFLMALARAEREKRLEAALPLLARQLSFPASVASDRKAELSVGILKILFAFQILTFVTIAVLPKFEEIVRDLLEEPFSASAISFWNTRFLFKYILGVGFAIASVLFIVCHIEGIGEYVVLRLPVIGRDLRCFLLSDLARSMAAFLRQGEDIVTSAEWSLKATRSYWLRKRLQRFTEEVRRGTNWLDAWSNIGLQRPLDDWLIRNAAARQDPASGFDLMAQWLHQEIQLTTRRLERWIDPCFTLIVAAVVLALAWQVFSLFTGILWGMMR